ncbi:fatty acid desaturase 1 (delta-5 desaturase) [Strigomonas culicis]|uniref:Fatty acid desaturase 1 (Delta-5 desaturase) n=1 Tax=Strigomonas culicis TaxID=28005 RepID=S9TXZ0_9TRYP|nr:fatty acid desaturase 1 (delta-5 desaturase) [Strigomonas culicis]|eukprot:EPY21464.1 fatty acid desaturase 1 (delta-5 desaturase) [Strigomonas culicis]
MSDKSNLAQQPHEIYIKGRLYDCSNFKHPGGSVIKFFLGSGDATEHYEEFHVKLPKADKYLSNLPSRPAPADLATDTKEQARLQKLSTDFRKLRDEFVKEGLYDANWPHIIYRFFDVFLVHFIGLYLLFSVPSMWPLACLVLGVAEGRCGWWMHEAGHYSCTGIPQVDLKIQELLYGFGCGMSASWWRVQHNKHHATPQKEHHDVDLETLPLVAFNKVIGRRGRKYPIIRWWVSVQAYFFAPITCSLIALYWQLYLHVRHARRARRYTEQLAILSRWAVVGLICHTLRLTVWQGLFGVLFAQAFGAAYIFVNFSLNHTHLPTLPADRHVHFVEYSSIFTMDVAPTWFVNWLMGYLNFQIEHHLFPCMPQFRFVAISPRVRKLFEDNGLTYDSRGYMDVLRITFRNLGEVGSYMMENETK